VTDTQAGDGRVVEVVGQEGFILVSIGNDGSEEVLMALTGEGAEDGIREAAKAAMVDHDRLEVRTGIAPWDLTWN
jgi:hypothetical protein